METLKNLLAACDFSPYKDPRTCRLEVHLLLCATPLLIFIGLAANVLAFSVLCRRRMRVQPVFRYLATIIIVDLSLTLWTLFRNLLEMAIMSRNTSMTNAWTMLITTMMIPQDEGRRFKIYCAIANYVTYNLLFLSPWLIIALNFQRITSYSIFDSIRGLSGLRSSRIIMVCMVFLIMNITSLWQFISIVMEPIKMEQEFECTIPLEVSILEGSLFFYTPIIFLFLGTLLLTLKLLTFRYEKFFVALLRIPKEECNSKVIYRKAQNQTKLVIGLNVFFILCWIPDYYFREGRGPFYDHFRRVFNLLGALKFILKFFILVATCEEFREELCNLLTFRRSSKPPTLSDHPISIEIKTF